MKIIHWRVTCLALFLFSQFSSAGIWLGDTISAEQMKEDIDYYFNSLKKIHPRLYHWYTEAQFDSLQYQLKEECDAPMDVLKFKYILARTNGFMDGHSQINFLTEQMEIGVISGLNVHPEEIVLKGKKVLSVNRIPAAMIARHVTSLVSPEYLPQTRQNLINSIFTYYLYAYHRLIPPYQFTVYDPEEKENEEISVNLSARYFDIPSSYDPEYHNKTVHQRFWGGENIAVFYYNSCDIYDDDYKTDNAIERRLDSLSTAFFNEVKKRNIQYVFIDISRNPGGSDTVHKYLNRYLKSDKYTYKSSLYIKPDGFQELYESIPDKKKFKKIVSKLEKATRRRGYTITTTQRKQKGFNGKVFLLTGSRTGSAAYTFCEQFRRGNKGIMVGETPGQQSPFCGNMITRQLPNSGLKYNIATTYDLSMPSLTNCEGFLEPDIFYPSDHPLQLEDYKKIIELSEKM